MRAVVRRIAYHLPERVVSNAELAAEFPAWSVEKIEAKTGIRDRHVAAPGETSVDLAVAAARRLLDEAVVARDAVDFVLFCTQTPDHFLPTSACLIQDRLGLRTSAGALDFNLGCSGFVYGLGLAKGLVETGQARSVLLLTADTYTKLIHRGDKSVRTLFGDAGAATLIGTDDACGDAIGPFVYGTDGAGAPNLVVPAGGMREACSDATAIETTDRDGNVRSRNHLYMNGREIFNFTVDVVPALVRAALDRAKVTMDDIDLVVFHQANAYLLEHLRKRIEIPSEKFLVALDGTGNTVSCSIPIALAKAADAGRLKAGSRIMLVGFGVGYSWGATFLEWPGLPSP
jgi:3-oxoacyl-[acyl-carrier-protein] synthase-3